MDLTYPPEAEEFRTEIRSWLEENLPEGWFDEGFEMTPDEKTAFNEKWTRTLHDGGWICATWPREYGGKGLTTMQGVVLAEEFARARAPMRADFFGDTLVGPTILMNGTEEQKEFLPKILNGEMRWCQGFSEPDSGSDLASLKTTAVLDGDEWVVNGQKVWTTQAQFAADYCFVLARTDPNVKKQAGISYLLVPMRQPGIEVRGITQPDGTAEFNEVFFNDARCPVENVVGGVNNGWKVANDTLGFERGMSATTGHRRFEEELRRMVALARKKGLIDDPVVRQGLARYWSRIQILRINGLRNLTATVSGRRDLGTAALGATNKMFWSEMHQQAMDLAIDILGAEGMLADAGPEDDSWPATLRNEGRDSYHVSPMVSAYFFSRSETIWGGSSQIQRNIVGERVLGLPREPKAPS